MEKKYILSSDKALMKIKRMAFEILERNPNLESLCLAGIRENGLVLCDILSSCLREISSVKVDVISVNINKKDPLQCSMGEQEKITGQVVVLVDDVVNSGKTMLYALSPLLSLAPHKIQTLTLVERSYKTYPVHVDYVGVSLASTLEDHIVVAVQNGRLEGAYLE